MTKSTQTNCPHCGAQMKEYWHTLTPGLVRTLIMFARQIKINRENLVHVDEQMGYTHNQLANFQKLKYWGLVAKADDGPRTGNWVITANGILFLKGEIYIPKRVRSYRAQLVGKDESERVSIKDFAKRKGELEYWETEFDFKIHNHRVI